MKKITFKINNKKIICTPGTSIMEAAKENGIFIPSLCFHPDLPAKGNCRVCVVEIKGYKKLVASCSMKAQEGMEIKTNSPRVIKSRNMNLELIFAEHVEKCPTCISRIDCQLLKLAKRYKLKITEFPDRKKYRKTYKFANAVEIDGSQCIDCGSCTQACEILTGINYLKLKGKGSSQEIVPREKPDMLSGLAARKKGFACVYCGQCALHCPVGSAQEQVDIPVIEKMLKNKKSDEIYIAQIAPSIRVSIGEEFGIEPGKIVTGQLIAALKKIGFDKVFDVNFGADITTLVEADELIKRLKKKKSILPMMTSCCPAWVKYVEFYRPNLIPNLTTARSPQIHLAGIIKTYWAKKHNVNPKKIKIVAIMPCTAKKFESARKDLRVNGLHLVNNVLTTRELAYLVHINKINLAKIKPQKGDDLLSDHTGAAAIYGGTGGVMESALRSAGYFLNPDKPKLGKIKFKDVRGLEGVKEATVKIGNKTLQVAVINGLANFNKIVDQLKKYHYIEVMACRGGCIGGGGQPIPTNDEIRKQRIKALYSIDDKKKRRKAHQNKTALEIIEWLEKNDLDHKVLHTQYKEKFH